MQEIFEFTAAVFALILYSGAYIAEHFRSGIASIPKSQMESALSSGLTYMQSMRVCNTASGIQDQSSTVDQRIPEYRQRILR